MDSLARVIVLVCILGVSYSFEMEPTLQEMIDGCSTCNTAETTLCYTSVSHSCEHYVECRISSTGSGFSPVLRKCAHGLHFMKGSYSNPCQWPRTAACEIDKCTKDRTLNAYKGYDNNCIRYWKCEIDTVTGRRSSTGVCCAENTTFNAALQMCDENIYCNESCVDEKKTGCILTANPNNPKGYYNDKEPQNCSEPLVFSQKDCDCVKPNEEPPTVQYDQRCINRVLIEFDSTRTENARTTGTTWVNLANAAQYGNFKPDDFLQIPFYDGNSVSELTVKIVFNTRSAGNQVLISKCGGMQDKNDDFIIQLKNDKAYFSGGTNGEMQFQLDYMRDKLNTLAFSLHNNKFRAIIEADGKRMGDATRTLKKIGSGVLRIGKSCHLTGFEGDIKEIWVANCYYEKIPELSSMFEEFQPTI